MEPIIIAMMMCLPGSEIQGYIRQEALRHDIAPRTALAVSYCESRYYENATGTAAVVGKDIGPFQINTYYHEDRAAQMGFDIHDPKENVEYAMRLMKKKGLQPWSASKDCWSNKI